MVNPSAREFQHASSEVLGIAKGFGISLKREPVKHVYVYDAAVITSLGDETEMYDRMLAGEIGIKPFDLRNFRTHFAAPVDVDLTQHYDKKELRDTSFVSGLADIMTRRLAARLGLIGENGKLKSQINTDKFAMCIGSGAGSTLEFIDAYNAVHYSRDRDGNLLDPVKGSEQVDGRAGRRVFPQDVVARAGMSIGAQGEGTSSTEACATGLGNLVLLYRSIKNGHSDAGIGGGVEGILSRHPLGFGHYPEAAAGIFAKMHATSDEKDDAKKASRQFSRNPPGFVMGEGGGLLVLGNERFGEDNNLTPIAEILAADKGMDAYHPTSPLPDRVARVILRALIDENNEAVYQPDVYAGHVTGTAIGDSKEREALDIALGGWAKKVLWLAPKLWVAHQMGGAGAVTAYTAIEALRRQKTPGLKIDDMDPQFLGYNIPQEPRDIRANIATAAAFGFGGLNAAMTFGKV